MEAHNSEDARLEHLALQSRPSTRSFEILEVRECRIEAFFLSAVVFEDCARLAQGGMREQKLKPKKVILTFW